MIKNYFSIDSETENLIVIEKSKFICNIKHVENENEAKEFISNIKKKESLANHHCYAYIADELGLIAKFSDDGEPQGTAGLPMLETLKSNDLKKVCAVVTRYFGGVLLGTGGLTRAYSGSVSEVIKKSKKINYIYSYFLEFIVNYDENSVLQNFLLRNNITILSIDYFDKVNVKIVLPYNNFSIFESKIIEAFNGKKCFDIYKEDFFAYRCKNERDN